MRSLSRDLFFCANKKKQLTPAFSPLLLLGKVANACFKCAKKVIRARPLNTIPVKEGFIGVLLYCYLETRWYSFLRPLNTVPMKEGFSPSVVVLLPVFPFTVFLA